jgi:uncharacterized protein (UPF0332 family)
MAYLKPEEILERAKEYLQCAEYALENDLINACAICSYAALFWAARAALAREGFNQPKWQHSELRSKFSDELIEKRKRYPKNFNRWLADAYALRNAAQYFFIPPKAKKVRRLVHHTKDFFQQIEERISK